MSLTGPAPTRKRRRWPLVVLLLLVGIIVIAAISHGPGHTPASAPASDAASGAPATSSAAPAPKDDDPLEDKGWKAADVQAQRTSFGTAITARVTNTDDQPRTGVFTLTVFDATGERLAQSTGSADKVGAGQTVTVTFVGTTEKLPGDPASYRFQFQVDMTN